MEMHVIQIVRFMLCMGTLVTSLLVMWKADDNNALRRLSAVSAAVIIYFNEKTGSLIYLLIGSTLESLFATMGVGFMLILCLVIMISPLACIIRWVIR